jgi:hypothetical protein
MKELPLSLTINGVTYYSQHHLATTQTTWFELGKTVGIEEGKKSNGISNKEIPGEYLADIEKAYDDGYADGYKDCREIVEHILKYGKDEDGVE